MYTRPGFWGALLGGGGSRVGCRGVRAALRADGGAIQRRTTMGTKVHGVTPFKVQKRIWIFYSNAILTYIPIYVNT